jgi:hypothetical protein
LLNKGKIKKQGIKLKNTEKLDGRFEINPKG